MRSTLKNFWFSFGRILVALSIFILTPEIVSAQSTFYWADALNKRIKQTSLNGSSTSTIVTTTGQPEAISVDLTNQKIFWSEGLSGSYQILRADLDGSNKQTIRTQAGTGIHAYGIAVNPATSQVYWTDTESDGHVYRANYDGSSATALVTPASGSALSPMSIFLDLSSNRIYLTSSAGIVYAPLDGGSITNLITEANPALALDLDPTSGVFYYTTATAIKKINRDGTGAEEIFSADSSVSPQPTFIRVRVYDAGRKLYLSDLGSASVLSFSLADESIENILSVTFASDLSFGTSVPATPTPTPTITPTRTPTRTPAPTVTPGGAATDTPVPEDTATPTPTPTRTATPTSIATNTPLPVNTATRVPTSTPTPTDTPTTVASPAPEDTPVPTETPDLNPLTGTYSGSATLKGAGGGAKKASGKADSSSIKFQLVKGASLWTVKGTLKTTDTKGAKVSAKVTGMFDPALRKLRFAAVKKYEKYLSLSGSYDVATRVFRVQLKRKGKSSVLLNCARKDDQDGLIPIRPTVTPRPSSTAGPSPTPTVRPSPTETPQAADIAGNYLVPVFGLAAPKLTVELASGNAYNVRLCGAGQSGNGSGALNGNTFSGTLLTTASGLTATYTFTLIYDNGTLDGDAILVQPAPPGAPSGRHLTYTKTSGLQPCS